DRGEDRRTEGARRQGRQERRGRAADAAEPARNQEEGSPGDQRQVRRRSQALPAAHRKGQVTLKRAAFLAAALALASTGAYAQYTYRCTSADGKKYYGATIPQQCIGQPVEVMSPQGTLIRRLDPEGDEKAQKAKE